MHNLCENNLLFELGRGVYVQKKCGAEVKWMIDRQKISPV